MVWTPDLISLFEELKVTITSSPVLDRFDPLIPTFKKKTGVLKEWSGHWYSRQTTYNLLNNDEYTFDLSKCSAPLRPVRFWSRVWTDFERKHYLLVGEAASGRWTISQNRHYLWDNNFWWMCDCAAVKEILEYEGNISQICRWAQESFGYQFAIVHRSYKKLMDVNVLSRRFGPSLEYTTSSSDKTSS